MEAARVALPEHEIGPEARLREAWERYRLPIAVTEVHHGCTRDEQLRWLMEVWGAAARLRAERVDMRAVTVWSLFGAVDWDTLLTQDAGLYEPGAFDIRSIPPRPTALARAAAALATTGDYRHPVLDTPGWWRRPDRFYRPHGCRSVAAGPKPRSIWVTGADRTLRRALVEMAGRRGLVLTSSPPLRTTASRNAAASR